MFGRRDDIAVASEVCAKMCCLPAMTGKPVAEHNGWKGLVERLGISHRFLDEGREAWHQRVGVLSGRVQVLAGVRDGCGVPNLDWNVLFSA
jgi:hypothetical protein